MVSNGNMFREQAKIGEVFSQYFSQLFSSSNPFDFKFSLQVVNLCVMTR